MRIARWLSIGLFFGSIAAGRPVINGIWDGTIAYDDYRIPFSIEFSQHSHDVSASFFNGDDRITSTGGTLEGDDLHINFDHYATRLTATWVHGVLKGTYGSARYGFHDFEAWPHRPQPRSHVDAPDISGVWDLPTESPKGEHAWILIVRQENDKASAAVLRVDGDTGTLDGHFAEGKWTLYHFDGARASLMEICLNPDGTLGVDLRGFHNSSKHYTAVKLDQAKARSIPLPTDPDEHTRVKDWSEPFRFSFPDLNGHVVSNTDPQFRGKVVIVNVTGSWCPNCHDEAPFLAALYEKYHSRGLEIVALDFEEPEQRKDPARLQAFIRKYGIRYTYLLAGEPAELEAEVPQAENLNSWPTTFFLGRDGTVKAIHAGFAGSASGPFHEALMKETTRRIEDLLSETDRAVR